MGGAGKDILKGGAGDDMLDGGAGNDTFFGSGGNDVMQGGAGNDLFIFGASKTGAGDVVVDGGGEGKWTDTIEMSDQGGPAGPGNDGWTLVVDGQTVDGSDLAQARGKFDLSDDAEGEIHTQDGQEIHFQNIDRIEW